MAVKFEEPTLLRNWHSKYAVGAASRTSSAASCIDYLIEFGEDIPRQLEETVEDADDDSDRLSFVSDLFRRQIEDDASKLTDRLMWEDRWLADRRPYYHVYPKVLEAFLRTSLDIPVVDFNLPVNNVLLMFPEHSELAFEVEGQTHYIRSCLVGHMSESAFGVQREIAQALAQEGIHKAVICHAYVDQKLHDYDARSRWQNSLVKNGRSLIEQYRGEQDVSAVVDYQYLASAYTLSLAYLVKTAEIETTTFQNQIELAVVLGHWLHGEDSLADIKQRIIGDRVARIVAAVGLLDKDDNDLFQPEVLAADRQKYEDAKKAKDQKKMDALVEKARRRGKVGWSIGEHIEMSPHVRRPHFFNVPCGKGRTQRKLVWRKGSVVHRDKLKEVPTGYLDEEQHDNHRKEFSTEGGDQLQPPQGGGR
jgi:hypothetical protein